MTQRSQLEWRQSPGWNAESDGFWYEVWEFDGMCAARIENKETDFGLTILGYSTVESAKAYIEDHHSHS